MVNTLLEQILNTADLDPRGPAGLRVLDTALLPVLAIDDQGLLVYENNATASLLGHEAGEFAHQHVMEMIAYEPQWTLDEFERLKTSGRWRGLVAMSHRAAEPITFEGKALLTRDDEHPPLYFATLRRLNPAADAFGNRGIGAYGLSCHEAVVLQLMAEGLSDREIAYVLRVSVWTVHKQSAAVLRKMDALSRTQAAIRAVREGLV